MKQFTLAEVRKMRVLHQSHFDNLIYANFDIDSPFRDGGEIRVWLSRCTIEDGMPYNNQITVEEFDANAGRWNTIDVYEAK